MRRSTTSLRAKRALGAALAGILAGSGVALGCGQQGEATPTEANGCNGPNGCAGEQAEPAKGAAGAAPAAEADANGCNGPNGCAAEPAAE